MKKELRKSEKKGRRRGRRLLIIINFVIFIYYIYIISHTKPKQTGIRHAVYSDSEFGSVFDRQANSTEPLVCVGGVIYRGGRVRRGGSSVYFHYNREE
jgi:hypothetical protein